MKAEAWREKPNFAPPKKNNLIPALLLMKKEKMRQKPGDVAQSVEQRTENPCVDGSIPPITTLKEREKVQCFFSFLF